MPSIPLQRRASTWLANRSSSSDRGGKRVFFDAEHFFDGCTPRRYALGELSGFRRAGAERVVLCDTNGGALPSDIAPAVEAVSSAGRARFGSSFPQRLGRAVANSLTALSLGCPSGAGLHQRVR